LLLSRRLGKRARRGSSGRILWGTYIFLPLLRLYGAQDMLTIMTSTYNVLEACRKVGIKNIVLASSETLIGIPFDPHPPASLPITEEHERRPESAYSLSKLMGETMAEQYTRWDPELKIVSLRFSNVMLPHEYAAFESWQKDPKARYWNCWGYIGTYARIVLEVKLTIDPF